MPWKAFMQSSALTNSDNQLANELFMQRENASCSLNIAPKWGDSVFELFCCHLETHFEVIQEKSAHVDPSTPCDGLQSMLYLCAVSGLVWLVLPFGLLPLSCRWLARYVRPSCPNQIEKAFLICHWRWTQCRCPLRTCDSLCFGMLHRYRPFARHCQ